MIYVKVYLNGEFLRYGNILALEYRGTSVRQQAYYYGEVGHEGYYTVDGEPLRRMFLKAPCRYRRISSPFDLNRKHPVLNTVRPHLGVDYAASTGTHVMAVADGTVEFKGRRGAAGNLVILRHKHGYKTAYAHLHGFARGLQRGDEVEQGELIGFVGNTGRSTGPHLHFGMKYQGRYIDPLENADRRLPGLSGRELDEFKRVRDQLRLELEEVIIPDVEVEEAEEQGGDQASQGINDEYVPHEF
jgi:murein DD-endopeptidase MepM/ murein hydrolase activator NlpD